MSFKNSVLQRIVSAFLIAVSAFVLTSCSLYEGPQKKRRMDLGQGSLGCMKDFKTRLNRFLDGKSTPENINQMADCAKTAVKAFRELARGENRGRFTAIEMRDFLQRYFLEDIVITDELLKEYMRVKQAFLGGKSTDFTPEDLDSAEDVIETVRDLFLRAQPIMPISLERIQGPDSKYVDQVAEALSGSADILASKISEKTTTYSFEELGRLLEQTMRVVKGTETLGQIRDHLGLAEVLKEVLVSSDHSRKAVTATEWKIILLDGGRWAGSVLKLYQLQAQPEGWLRGKNRDRFGRLVNEMLDLTERFVARHCPERAKTAKGCAEEPGVPLHTFSDVVDASKWDGKVGNFTVTHATVKTMLNVFVLRVLGGTEENVTGRRTNRLTRFHVSRFRSMLQDWLDGSRYLEGAFATLSKDAAFQEGAAFPTATLAKLDPATLLLKSGGLSQNSVRAAEDLRAEIQKTVALEKGLSGVAVFDGVNSKRPRTYAELSKYTWLKPAFNRLVLGYMEKDVLARAKDLSKTGLKQDEFTSLIGDFWPVLVDFALVNYKNNYREDSAKRFREASLFTQVSDGNDVISVSEGMQLILYMLSTDPLSKRVHARAVEICGGGALDMYGEPTIDPDCYRTRVWNFSTKNPEMKDLWAGFPNFMRFYDSLSEETRKELRTYIEAASRKPESTPMTPFASDDSQSAVMILHYVETLFMNFDRNQDGVINRAEAQKAFSVFARVLGEMAQMNPAERRLQSVFYWVLSRGAPPVNENMGWWTYFWSSAAFIKFDLDIQYRPTIKWLGVKPLDFKASRLDLFKVFATLSAPPKAEN